MNNFKTPYFLIDKTKLDNNYNAMKEAFKKEWKNIIIGYSFKTNSLPWIINFLKNKGAYAEVVSEREYELAKYLGYSDKIIYNGPLKGERSVIEALNKGAIVNLDSFHEVEWLKNARPSNGRIWKIGLRINFDLEKRCPGETSCGTRGGRFGFNYENGELASVIDTINSLKYIKISGIHLHNSSKTRSLNIYKNIAKLAVEIKDLFRDKLEYIDIGGGFYGGLTNKPQYSDYAKVISSILKEKFSENIYLIIEPGASLIASPISFYTSVVSVKKVKDTIFATVDGSCNNLNPLMQNKNYFYEIISKVESRFVSSKQIIAGYTCMENDTLLTLESEKLLSVGDIIKFDKVGSYTMTLSPLFIEYFPAVIVKDKNEYYYARKPWGIKEFVQKNYIEKNEKEI